MRPFPFPEPKIFLSDAIQQEENERLNKFQCDDYNDFPHLTKSNFQCYPSQPTNLNSTIRSTLSFTLTSKYARKTFADFIVIDSQSWLKVLHHNYTGHIASSQQFPEYGVVFVGGLDSHSNWIVLWIGVFRLSPDSGTTAIGNPQMAEILEDYITAGFRKPKCVVMDNSKWQKVIQDKFKISEDDCTFVLSFSEVLKELKKSMMKKDFKNKDRKELLDSFNSFQHITQPSDYITQFNNFYMSYRGKSDPLK